MKIAVIDSGVNLRDDLLAKQNIEAIKIEQDVCQTFYTDCSGHGTDIVKIICDQTIDPHIVSIQVLNSNNKASVDALCRAINYCTEIEVDVINLSLGLSNSSNEKIQKLKHYCDAALEKGIVIISANHNYGNLESHSYPFAFNEILGVNSSSYLESKIKLDYKQNNIIFSDNVVSVPSREGVVLRKGNSFLAPVITGLYSEFVKRKVQPSNDKSDFLMFMEQIQRNHTNLFFYKNKEQSYQQFKHKKIGYFFLKKTKNDINVIKLLHQYTTVRLYNLAEEVENAYISELDFLFFGEISKGDVERYKPMLVSMIETAVRQGIHIVMIIPLMSIYQRLQVSEKYKVCMQSVYI